MRVEVRLFAGARDRAGTAAVTVEVPDTATVADLRRRLSEQCPALQSLLAHSVFVVNDEFAADTLAIAAGAVVALLPPVSGGRIGGVCGCDR